MFDAGDYMIYGNHGVCHVDEIGLSDVQGFDEARAYYTLSPMNSDMKIYTPVDTQVFIRPLVSGEEARTLIESMSSIEDGDYGQYCGNTKVLSAHYDRLIQRGSAERLLKLIKIIHRKHDEIASGGKKLNQTDRTYLRRAEEMVCDEFAIALDMSVDGVKRYMDDTVEASR
ncbi:hypothetical protein B9G55_14985 [Saccharibacillus sp. O16]|nr:hypothetical protein B9G55_14985 [Saccharibacillus sp. O16]